MEGRPVTDRPSQPAYATACELLVAEANMHVLALPLSELTQPLRHFHRALGQSFPTINESVAAAQSVVNLRTVAA